MASKFRVKHSISILASLDDAEKKIGFQRAGDSIIQTIREDLEVGKADTRVIDESTVDEALELGGVTTAALLYIETDQELLIKINGGTEEFKLSPTTGYNAKLFWEGEFTALSVSNVSLTTKANITYLVAGV